MPSAHGPLVLKNLDDYHVWTVKHRHWMFELAQDRHYNLWLNTRHLRDFYDHFPSDKVLSSVYRHAMLYDKRGKAHYLPLRALRGELLKSKGQPMHTDILRFLDWFGRNVTDPMAKKKTTLHLDERNALRDDHAKAITGPIPTSMAPPQLDASTLPMTLQERWALEQQDTGPRKVYHPNARPVRAGWDHWPKTAWQWCRGTALSFARGEHDMFATFVMGLFILMLPACYLDWAAPDSLDWTASYRRVMWAYATLVLVALACAALYGTMLTRSLLRAWRTASHRIFALFFCALVIQLAPHVVIGNYDEEMLDYWWANVRGNYHPMTVYADPHLGRIVARGPMEFGSAEALQQVLDQNPRYTLIEIDSPGGFVIEGIRMADIVAARKMDTVVMSKCASACTLLLVVGKDRYLAPNALVGFHRSGRKHLLEDRGWSETDQRIADHYRSYGAAPDFVTQALQEPMFRIWWAPHADMYRAGYANKAWSERKSGY